MAVHDPPWRHIRTQRDAGRQRDGRQGVRLVDELQRIAGLNDGQSHQSTTTPTAGSAVRFVSGNCGVRSSQDTPSLVVTIAAGSPSPPPMATRNPASARSARNGRSVPAAPVYDVAQVTPSADRRIVAIGAVSLFQYPA